MKGTWFKAVVFALVMLLGLGVAQKLTFWHYWDGANGQALQALIERYQKDNPGVSIEAVFVPGSELLTKLQTAITARQTPTMAISDLVAMPLLTRSGALAPLDDYIRQGTLNLADYFAGPLVYGVFQGRRYSLPVSASNLGLFWNKNLFRQAGLDPNRPPRNWDELLSFARQIKERTGKWGIELFTQGGEGTTWQTQVYFWGAGAEFLNANNTAPAFNSAQGVRALQFLVDLVQKEKVATVAPWGLFGRGEAAMVMDGSWMTQFFPQQVNFELGAAAFPFAPGGRAATNMGGEQVFIFQSSEAATVRAAWNFIQWFSSTPVQVEWNRNTGFLPVRRSVASDPAYRAWVGNARPLMRPFVDSMAVARPRPPVTRYPQISDIFARYVQEALLGRLSPQDALNRAAQEITPLLR
ncbi:ABC transporter substrate-binding protein [uncultured Meiothermus sp.]|jgi:multiple sugar transport system substrate-binding protein|uniref:ABC transporter substrate-binding protein n=1 Tax=uncultured Meiothermus sp. TaxID=157471 RepID=UPI002627E09E|nr:ABC transporter substrate-binding protein [uncultured Meiothermus sp.]